MQLLRRIAPVLAVGLVAAGLVVLDPSGPPAFALVSPPQPLTWNPAAVGVEANTLNPSQWNTALNANPNKVLSNVRTIGSGASKVGVTGALGTVGVAVGGFMVGTDLGTGIAGSLGLPTTGSFWCDLGVATGVGESCAIGPSVDYVINSDAPPGKPPGWVDANRATTVLQGTVTYSFDYWAEFTGVAEVLSAPAWHGTGEIVVKATVSGICHDTSYATGSRPSFGVAAYTVPRSNLAAEPTVTASSALGAVTSCTAPETWTRTATLTLAASSNVVLDHLVVTVGSESAGLGTGTAYLPVSGLQWWPEASPNRPVETSSDPQRWWRTTWECSTGTPGGVQQSAPFRESDVEWPAMPNAVCDPSAVVTSILVEQLTEGMEAVEVYRWDAPAGYREWATSNCAGGGCQLLLSRIDEVTGKRLSCFSNSSLCTQWSEDPAREDKYECSYGGEVVPLTDCLVYAPSFDPEADVSYADPEGNVGTGTGTDPGSEPQDDNCPPPFSWTSMFNPWWHYKSVTCALSEVFVPKSPLRTAQVSQALDASVLGAVGDASGTVGASFETLGSRQCGVIVETEPTVMLGNGVTVDTCGYPWSSMGAIRLVVGTGFILGAVIIGIKSVMRTIRVEVDQAPTAGAS